MSNTYTINGTSIFSYDSSYTVFTSNRASGGIYQNPSINRPMYVMISVRLGSGSNNTMYVQCDSSSNPTKYIIKYNTFTLNDAVIIPLQFFVPPLHYYKVTGNSWNYSKWVESILLKINFSSILMSGFYNIGGISIFSYDSSYTVLTSNRESGGIYQNPSDKRPMRVSIDVHLYAISGANIFNVKCDSSPNPSTYIMNYSSSNSAFIIPVTFFVPPLYFYTVNGNSWNYNTWVEYII